MVNSLQRKQEFKKYTKSETKIYTMISSKRLRKLCHVSGTLLKYLFQTVPSDLFTFNGKNYLLLVYSFPVWYDFKKLKQTSAEINLHLKHWFALLGIPAVIKTDNGPQYGSSEFSKCAALWQIEHRTPSSAYPQSNRLAECYVKVAEVVIEKVFKRQL